MSKILSVVLGLFAVSMMGCAHNGHHGHDGHHGHHGHHGKKACSQKKWEKMDTDKDGAISKAEFDKAHADKFAAMDANKDGKVTKEEKMAWKKAKHAAKDGKKKACCK